MSPVRLLLDTKFLVPVMTGQYFLSNIEQVVE